MTKSPSNPNQTLALLGVLLLVIGVGGAYYYFLPQLIDARTQEATTLAQKQGLEQDIQTLQQAQTDLGAAQVALQNQGVNFGQLQMHYPTYEEVPNLYLQMEALISGNPQIKNITYQIGQPVKESNEVVKIPMTVTGGGSYSDLKTFAEKLENSIRPLTLIQLSFAISTGDTSDKTKVVVPAGDYILTATGYARAEKLSPSYSETPKP
jgi:Tfp pilus assembly protein PilO